MERFDENYVNSALAAGVGSKEMRSQIKQLLQDCFREYTGNTKILKNKYRELYINLDEFYEIIEFMVLHQLNSINFQYWLYRKVHQGVDEHLNFIKDKICSLRYTTINFDLIKWVYSRFKRERISLGFDFDDLEYEVYLEACSAGCIEIVRWLISQNKDLRYKEYGFILACLNTHLNILTKGQLGKNIEVVNLLVKLSPFQYSFISETEYTVCSKEEALRKEAIHNKITLANLLYQKTENIVFKNEDLIRCIAEFV